MNSNSPAAFRAARISRAAAIALAGAFALVTITGCFGSPRATDTIAGAAIGAGTGALIGGAEGSPGTGALIGGLGGGAVGYIVGTETEHYRGYGGYGPYGYYPGGY
jgi:osmotically inducible lipoprotein OsmB